MSEKPTNPAPQSGSNPKIETHLARLVEAWSKRNDPGADSREIDTQLAQLVKTWSMQQENWDDFARLLGEVLPQYVKLIWHEEVPYKRHFKAWQAAGVTILPNHYYSPVPDLNKATPAMLGAHYPLHGLHLDDREQLGLLGLLKKFKDEYNAFASRTTPRTDGKYFQGGPFARPDADAAYAMIRHLKPKRIIEIGSGFSTLAMAEACVLNEQEGFPVDFLSIDPYPSYVLNPIPPGLSRHLPVSVEDLPLETFSQLSENDVLFIDSTHVIRPGGDVEYEFFHVIPQIGAGCWVHVHDIFLPQQYPANWMMEEHIFWNEQQLLLAFLAYNGSYQPRLALAYLCEHHPQAVCETFASLPPPRPHAGSFWFQRTAGAPSPTP